MSRHTIEEDYPQTFTVNVGDVSDVLPTLGTFDAVLSDPPYGLSFMSKGWDHSVPGPDVWRLVLERLRPGASVFAFGGTRTFHHLALAFEQSGFEIRDMLMWMYGCLDEESEILTADGWKRGTEVEAGDIVATWDPATEDIRLGPVYEVIRKPYRGPMISIKNDNTDQLLTPNHRVYRNRWSRQQVDGVRSGEWQRGWGWVYAGKIKPYGRLRLPLSGLHDGDGIGEPDGWAGLLGWVFTEGHFAADGAVWLYQSSTNQAHVDAIDDLIDQLGLEPGRYSREREYNDGKYTEHSWRIRGADAHRIRKLLPDKSPTWDLLWSMTHEEKVDFFNAAMDGDGSWGGLAFYQKSPADLQWFQALAHCIGMQGRINPSKSCVSLSRNGKTELQPRHFSEPVDYDGVVWCVRVETGAFIARRNGKIFATGNSGFPKNHDISKAIDKAAEREVVGRGASGASSLMGGLEDVSGDQGHDITTPATAAAQRFDGYGTALKPAYEPILWAMAPRDGSFANNATTHGVGGIDIDAGRVGTEGGLNGWGVASINKGRWPANVILDEAAGAMLDGQTGETASTGGLTPGAAPNGIYGNFGKELSNSAGGYGDSGGASRFFYCPKASKAEREAGLDGFRKTNVNDGRQTSIDNAYQRGDTKRRNVHPTVKPVDLCRYLAAMLLPPPRTDAQPRRILVPFSGSGSEMIGCLLAGWDVVVGIERNEEYAGIARARLEHWDRYRCADSERAEKEAAGQLTLMEGLHG